MGPGIITERDILDSIAKGEDPDTERVADHLTSELVFAAPDWSLEQAAVAMVRGGFRHLVVVEGGETAGILSVRDIVRCWTDDGASCELPAAARTWAPRRRPSGPSAVLEREVLDLPPGVADPDDRGDEEERHAQRRRAAARS